VRRREYLAAVLGELTVVWPPVWRAVGDRIGGRHLLQSSRRQDSTGGGDPQRRKQAPRVIGPSAASSPFGHSRAGCCSRPDPEVALESTEACVARSTPPRATPPSCLSPQDTERRRRSVPTQAHGSRVPWRALLPATSGARPTLASYDRIRPPTDARMARHAVRALTCELNASRTGPADAGGHQMHAGAPTRIWGVLSAESPLVRVSL
jgi:hypothetical protein